MARMRIIIAVFCALLGLKSFANDVSPEQRQKNLTELAEKILASGELNPDPNKTIQEYLPRLDNGTRTERDKAFGELEQKLSFAYNKNNFPSDENKQKLSLGLIKYYGRTILFRSTPRILIVEALAKYGDNQHAKPFILNVLDGSDTGEQDSALRMLGAPGGVSGPEFFGKVKELAVKRQIESRAIPTFLIRANKELALPGILEELRTTKDKETFIYTAWPLQDYYRDPDNYRYIVPRLKEFGLASDGILSNKSFRGGNGIGWIDADMFSQYIEKAPQPEAKEAFGIMVLDGLLCKPSTVPMLMRMLKHEDPAFRLLAARGLRKAAGYSHSDKSIYSKLKEAYAAEKDESTKTGIKTEIDTMDRHEMMRQRSRERSHQ